MPSQATSAAPRALAAKPWGLALLVGLLVAACQGPPAGGPVASSSARPNPSGPRPSPSQGAAGEALAPSSAPSASAPGAHAALRLPARLGQAFPASLVGKAAQARLAKADGQVAPLGSVMRVQADGRIISNNGSTLVSSGGGLVANNGSALISDHGAGQRLLAQAPRALLQAGGDATASGSEPLFIANEGLTARHHLWLTNAILDLNDQLLQAYLKAEPRLGQWRRFTASSLSFMPPPFDEPAVPLLLEALAKSEANRAYAGLLTSEAGGARLRIVLLPEAGAPLREGSLLMDHQSEGGDGSVMQGRALPSLEDIFGLASSVLRIRTEAGPWGPHLRLSFAERHLPPASRSFIGQSTTAGADQLSGRIEVDAQVLSEGVALVRLGVSQVQGTAAKGYQELAALSLIGFVPPPAADAGLALLYRKREGPVGQANPMLWQNQIAGPSDGQGPPSHLYLLPSGQAQLASTAALAPLKPSYRAADDAFIPAVPGPLEDPTLDPALAPPSLDPALLALPESP